MKLLSKWAFSSSTLIDNELHLNRLIIVCVRMNYWLKDCLLSQLIRARKRDIIIIDRFAKAQVHQLPLRLNHTKGTVMFVSQAMSLYKSTLRDLTQSFNKPPQVKVGGRRETN